MEEMEPQKLMGTDLLEMNPQLEASGATATFPVIWRAKPALVERFKDMNYKHPALLLVVRAPQRSAWGEHMVLDYTETKRWLVSLDKFVAYISFSRPGENEVCVTVLDIRNEEDLEHADKLVKEASTVLNKAGELTERTGWLKHINVGKLLEVHIPQEMFAPPPPIAFRWLVKQYYESKAYDQCHFRRRLLLSALVWTPLALTIGLAIRLTALLAALALGLREIEWSGLNPFNMGNLPWPEYSMRSYFLHNRDGHLYPLWPLGLIANPLVLFAFWLLGRLAFKLSWWMTIAAEAGTIGALALLGLVVWLVLLLVRRQPSYDVQAARRRQEREKEAQANRARLAALDALAYDRPLTMEALPPKYHTVALRFNQLKARVCRPFAR